MKKSQPPDPLFVNQKVLAKIFMVSIATVEKMEGLPSEKIGRERRYHLPTCWAWFLEKEAAKLSSLSEEQAKYTKARRERQELLLKKERGELMATEDAKRFFTMIGLHLKNTLESWPHRLAGRISGMRETRGVTLLLKTEVKDLLLSLKDMEIK